MSLMAGIEAMRLRGETKKKKNKVDKREEKSLLM